MSNTKPWRPRSSESGEAFILTVEALARQCRTEHLNLCDLADQLSKECTDAIGSSWYTELKAHLTKVNKPAVDTDEARAQDLAAIEEMEMTGGSFVQALGRAATRADSGNLQRIKEAFPELWATYNDLAKVRREKKGGAS